MRTTACALLLVTAAALPAAADKPKPMAGSYEVSLPVPYVADGKTTCADAEEGRSKHTKGFVFPARGGFTVALRDFVGAWDLEIYEEDRLVTRVEGDPSLGGEKRTVSLKRVLANTRYFVVICNELGAPRARIDWRFVFSA